MEGFVKKIGLAGFEKKSQEKNLPAGVFLNTV
jgi:hypothetical protein